MANNKKTVIIKIKRQLTPDAASRTGKGTSSTRADRSAPEDCGFSRWGPVV